MRLFCLLLIVTFWGCSTAPVKKKTQKEAHLSQEEMEALNKKAMEKVSARLEELSIAAKASGPDKVQFLASDFYLKASAALMEGDYQTANIIFKQLVNLVPEDMFIKKKYAVSLIRTGDLEQSQKLFEEVYKASKSKDVDSGLILAGIYTSTGKVNDAKKLYSSILKLDPKNEEACIFLGKTYALEEKMTKAVGLLNKCQARSPKKGIFSYYIGKLYASKKNYSKAQKYFRSAVKRQPDFTDAVMALGTVYEERGKLKKAEQAYKKYLEKDENSVAVLNRLVDLLFAQERYKDVIGYAERLSDLDSQDLNLKVKLGLLYTDVQEFDKAIKTFQDLLVYSPNNDKLLYYLAAIYQEISIFDKALETYAKVPSESALYNDSSLQMAHILSAMALLDPKKETKFLEHIAKKKKELTQFVFEFSMVEAAYYDNSSKNQDAIRILETISDNKSFTKEHQFYLASLYEKVQKFENAEKLMQDVLSEEPNDAHALNFLGYSLIERNERMDQAYKYIKQAIKLSPKDGYIRDSLGWYYFKVGKVSKALKELKKAIKIVPDDIAINKHLAEVYSSLKKFKTAKKYIKKAIEVAKSESEKEELNEILKELEANRLPASFK